MVQLRNEWLYIISQYEIHRGKFLESKESVFKGLFGALRIRELAIAQLTLDDLNDEMREFCSAALEERRDLMLSLERDFLLWHDLLQTRNTAIKLGKKIAKQLDNNIRLYDEAAEQGRVAGKNSFSS